MAQITRATKIGELLNVFPESLEEAAMVHGIDADLLVEKINAAMTAAGK